MKAINSQPLLLVVLATLFWAGNAIAGKMAVGHVSPFLLTTLRWLVAVVVLTPFTISQLKSDWQTLRSKLFLMCVLGAIGFTLFNNLMYQALTATSAINVAIIQSSMPLFIFILSALFFAIRVTKFQVVGFPITLLGVAVVTFQGSLALFIEQKLNMGDALMLLAVMAYAVYSVLLNKRPKIHWLSTMYILASAALVASLPFTLFEATSGRLVAPDLTGLAVVVYAAIFPSIAAQALWIRSIELIGANATSVYINLVPLFGSLLAVALLGEQLHTFHVIGFCLIIIGIYVGQLTSNIDA